jgi:hypothetical protein
VIYYFAPPDADFVAVYAKNEKENLSDSEKRSSPKSSGYSRNSHAKAAVRKALAAA